MERHPEQPHHALGRGHRRDGVFRKPSNNANGNTRDRQGRLVTCEHGARRVTRTEYDGAVTVICDSFEGKRLNSPNDVVVKSDGSIWFTDPQFGILGNYEGHLDTPELPMNVYRVDGKTGEATVVADASRAERPQLLARRDEALHRRVPRRAAQDPRLRRHRRRQQARQPQGVDRRRPGRHARRLPHRRRRQSVVRLGHVARLDGVRIFNPAGEPIGISHCPSAAPISVSAGTANRLFMAAAIRSIRSTSTRRARRAGEIKVGRRRACGHHPPAWRFKAAIPSARPG